MRDAKGSGKPRNNRTAGRDGRRPGPRPFENDRHESRFKREYQSKSSESRPGRFEHSERPAGSSRFERSGRPAGSSRFERSERPAGSSRFERSGRSAGNSRFERSGRPAGKPAFRKPVRPETEQPVPSGSVRLNKFIANSGVCSRREADGLIQAGVVTVNGTVVTELGIKVNPATDDIRFNGERLKGERKVYLVMNKPKGYVTTTADPHADRCVMDLISPELCPQRIFPVGRLDKSTTGVLLLTNDGALTEKLTHPSYERKKIYHVFLDRNLKRPDFEALLNGFELEDGFIAADALSYIDEHEDEVGMEIHSGRNRIVRRMFEHLGYTVKKLDRVYFAGLTKKNIKRGQWRFLTDTEIVMLKNGQYE